MNTPKRTSAQVARDKRLKSTYNSSLDEYDAKLAKQGNKCAICERPFPKFMAYQDHDHDCCPRKLKKFCGKCNRGLLCFLCNKYAVGLVEKLSKQGIDFAKVLAYLKVWHRVVAAKGGYEKKTKTSGRVPKKQKSV